MIDDKPVVSIAVSVLVTTALLGLLYKPLKSNWDEAGEEAGEEAGTEPSPSTT